MNKKLTILIISIMCLFIGSNVYAKTISTDSSGNYVISLSSNENIQNAIDSINMDDTNIKNAKGIIIELDGNFVNQQINIGLEKDVTIRGRNANSKSNLGIGQIKISSATSNVTLENLMFFGMTGSTPHEFVIIDTPIELTVDNVDISYAARPPSGALDTHLVILNFTENASGTKASITNSKFSGIYRAISMTGSNYDVTFDNTTLAGDTVIAMNSGENNHITMKNGSSISIGSSLSNSPNVEGISLKSQKNLTFDVVDSSIMNENRTKSNHIFSFDDANNEKCVINITGSTTIVDQNTRPDSKIFDFEEDKVSNQNKVLVASTVSVEPNDATEKYVGPASSFVVGIHDENGNATIKLYNGIIPLEDLTIESKIYVVKGWYQDKTFTKEFVTTNPVTENMDLYPKCAYPIVITVEGLSKDFAMLSNDSLEDFLNKYKDDLVSIVSPSKKVLSYFKNEDGEKLTDSYLFTEDTKIIPVYNVIITLDGEEFALEEGTTLDNLSSSEKERFTNTYIKTNKTFDYFVLKGTTTRVGNDYVFNENTELEAKYNVTVTVGSEEFTLEEGKSFNDLDQEALKELVQRTDKQFKAFVDSNNNPVNDDYIFNSHTTLIPRYEVTIKIGDEEFVLAENSSLNDLSEEDKTKLKTLINVEGKEFVNFIDKATGAVVNQNTKFSTNTELEIVLKDKEEIPSIPSETPSTYDNITTYIIMALASIVTIVGSIILLKKNN